MGKDRSQEGSQEQEHSVWTVQTKDGEEEYGGDAMEVGEAGELLLLAGDPEEPDVVVQFAAGYWQKCSLKQEKD